MLKLIEGGFYSDAQEETLRALEQDVAAGARVWLFVPEQQTVITEEQMARRLPPSAPLTFEVTNFPRFANTIFRIAGGIAGRTAGRAERALLMWKTLTELSPYLSSGGAVSPGTIDKMLGAIREMESFSITPEDLSAVGGVDDDRRLARKLSDLSRVMDLYRSLCAEKFSDGGDELLRTAEKLREQPQILRGAKIYFEGFTSFTEPQYALFSAILSLSDVTVSLTLPKAARDAFEFSEVREYERRLLRAADRLSVDKTVRRVEGRRKIKSELLADVGENLWRTEAKIYQYDNYYLHNQQELRLIEAESSEEMCDFAAADIKRRLMEDPALRYRDFAVVVRNGENYVGRLDRALLSAGIPIFFSRRRPVTSFSLIRLIRTAYAAASGFARADVIAFAKCPLSGMTHEETDELEIYCETWQITGRRFTDGIGWNMNPRGYDVRRPEGSEEFLLRVNAAREKLIRPLADLSERIRGVHTVREHAGILLSFLLSLGVPEGLAAEALALESAGETDGAMEVAGLYQVVCDSLDVLCDLLGEEPVDDKTFLSLLNVLFAEADVGRIPAYVDCVTVGSADQIRLRDVRHLYLLGTNDGEFPAAVEDASFFSDREKQALAAQGLPITPDLSLKSARELYLFSRAFSFAEESATLVWSRLDEVLAAQSPSDAVLRITEMTGKGILPRKLNTLPLIDRIFTPDYALEHLSGDRPSEGVIRALLDAGEERRLRVREGDLRNNFLPITKCGLDRLYGGEIPMTESRLDCFAACGMKHFCQYSLGLEEYERAGIDARTGGSFLHAILENFFREVRRIRTEEGRPLGEIGVEERDKMILRAAKEYLHEISADENGTDARRQMQIGRLKRAALPIVESLCEEFAACDYQPVFFELNISRKKDDNPDSPTFDLEDGRRLFLYGKIDRVDAAPAGGDLYVRVIDYKTGQKTFSPEDLSEGKNLQMFLYLKAIVETTSPAFLRRIGAPEGAKLIPGGVIYVKAAAAEQTAGKKKYDEKITEESILQKAKDGLSRLGMALDDGENLSHMDERTLPKKYDAKGNLTEKYEKFVYTAEGWDELMATVERSVRETAKKMTSGLIVAQPMLPGKHSSACDFCSYKPFCRNAVTKKK